MAFLFPLQSQQLYSYLFYKLGKISLAQALFGFKNIEKSFFQGGDHC
jgi:hypothetical protein